MGQSQDVNTGLFEPKAHAFKPYAIWPLENFVSGSVDGSPRGYFKGDFVVVVSELDRHGRCFMIGMCKKKFWEH